MAPTSNLKQLVYDAVEVVEFKLIRSRADVDSKLLVFHPYMAHQIFGETENIFGYKDLRVPIMYTAGPMQIYVGLNYSQRVENMLVNADGNELKADDVIGMVSSKFPDGAYYTNVDEFLNTLKKAEEFKPFGTKLDQYIIENKSGIQRHFEIYQCDITVPNFCSYFNRLQTLVLWFIDGATYIDTDDPQWTCFICYEKYKNTDGNYQYATVGYTTVYLCYAYPEHIRPRISQMLILPPFQKNGLATILLETINRRYVGDETVVDVTVENPSDEFQRIRTYVDAKLCKNLPEFDKSIIHKGFTKDMIEQAKNNYKINLQQARKVYEVLRLFHTNTCNEDEYRNYRLEVKKRLSVSYHKQLKDIEKLRKRGCDVEWLVATLPKLEERYVQLRVEYEAVEAEYEKIIKRLKF